MSLVLVTGDQAIYQPQFGLATVTVQPGQLSGSVSKFSVNGKSICVKGDEASAIVPGCAYFAGSYTIPGMGMLSVEQLAGDQVVSTCQINGTPLMVVGSQFIAKFTVTMPAQMPTPDGPKPDPKTEYMGQGTFTGSSKFDISMM